MNFNGIDRNYRNFGENSWCKKCVNVMSCGQADTSELINQEIKQIISEYDFGAFTNSSIKLHPTCGLINDKQHYGDGDLRASRPQDWILERQAKACELNNGGIINISMNGNTLMTVGDIVHINIPITGIDHDDEEIEYTSGNYLITKLRHAISPQNKQHEIHMQLVRDCTTKSYNQMEG